jgi:BirA family biotin operon repressor/biotin-[acetyl-CoA-carboxylase] ligase
MISTPARILQILGSGPAHPSELSKQLGEDAARITKAIESLMSEGFDLVQHPLLGWMLQAEPERLSSAGVLSRMKIAWLREISTLPTTPSTNVEALNLGSLGAVPPVAVFAEHQTSGRGRFGRSWDSASGEGLAMSLLLRPVAPQRHWPRLTTLAALAVAETIHLCAGIDVQIKWPNDVIHRGRKLAGILAETGTHPEHGPFVVLGIGVNVNQSGFAPPLSETAASLKSITGSHFNRTSLASILLDRIGGWLVRDDGLCDGFNEILKIVSRKSCTLGNTVILHSGSIPVEGYAEELDPDGCLRLRLPDGTLQSFSAGDVTFRPC